MWLIKSEVIRLAGGFDPLFFMYKEDDDLWGRVNYRGWKTGFFPKAIVYHHTTKESRFTIKRRIWHTYGNMILILKSSTKKFVPLLLGIIWMHIKKTITALMDLNKSELYVLQYSFFSVLFKIRKIYNHRKLCLYEEGAFI